MSDTLDQEAVQKIANLARLGLGAEDIKAATGTLTSILAFVAAMDAVNTDGIEPLSHPLDIVQRLRADKVTEENQRDDFLSLTPNNEAGLYLVPQVIE